LALSAKASASAFGPPVAQVARAVVLPAQVVEAVAELVADQRADAAVVRLAEFVYLAFVLHVRERITYFNAVIHDIFLDFEFRAEYSFFCKSKVVHASTEGFIMTAMPPISPASAVPAVATFVIPSNNEELSEALTRLAGHINAAQYRFLKLLAALIERDAWLGHSGMKSPAHWLNYYCGVDLGAAREKVRVAKCLGALPLIDAAFSTGVISYSKVRAMTRAATPENEAFLLQVATHGTAQHVEKLVRKFARASRVADARHDQRQYEARELCWYHDDDGMLVFRGRLPAAEGAAFVKAVGVLVQNAGWQKPAPQGSGQTEDLSAETSVAEPALTFPQKRADALVAMADLAMTALASDGKPACAADKYQVIVHVDAGPAEDVSAETSEQRRCTLESDACHFPLAATVARRLACDATLVTVVEDSAGAVLNVGRRTRTIPPAIRRALTLRDSGCRFPGCCETRFVDAHHIHHWCDGGETSLDNLVLLCRHHHGLLHQERFAIVQGVEGFEFVRADGRRLPRALAPQFADAAEQYGDLAIEAEDDALGLRIDARTAVTRWLGESMDYGFAVSALMDIGEARARARPPADRSIS
jgi:hypothetical protein